MSCLVQKMLLLELEAKSQSQKYVVSALLQKTVEIKPAAVMWNTPGLTCGICKQNASMWELVESRTDLQMALCVLLNI